MQYSILDKIYDDVMRRPDPSTVKEYNDIYHSNDSELTMRMGVMVFSQIEDQLYSSYDKLNSLSFKLGFKTALEMLRDCGLEEVDKEVIKHE